MNSFLLENLSWILPGSFSVFAYVMGLFFFKRETKLLDRVRDMIARAHDRIDDHDMRLIKTEVLREEAQIRLDLFEKRIISQIKEISNDVKELLKRGVK